MLLIITHNFLEIFLKFVKYLKFSINFTSNLIEIYQKFFKNIFRLFPQTLQNFTEISFKNLKLKFISSFPKIPRFLNILKLCPDVSSKFSQKFFNFMLKFLKIHAKIFKNFTQNLFTISEKFFKHFLNGFKFLPEFSLIFRF